jgi:excisionase family DNA binding protein
MHKSQVTMMPASNAHKLLFTVPEAAAALGVCRSVIYELMLCGELPNIRIGRARRIPLSALEGFIARKLGNVPGEASESDTSKAG